MKLPFLLVVSVATLIASYIAGRLLIQWMRQRQIVAIPNKRSSHSRPTPQGGGLVIVLSILGVWLLFLALTAPTQLDASILAYGLGGGLIAFISWRDDLKSVPYWLRLAFHSLGAVLTVTLIGYWQSLDLPIIGPVEIGWLGLPLTFLWIVGLTNAYNFMDGIDGLAGGQAAIAALSWAILSWQSGQSTILSLSLFLLAGTLGFLAHNWPPARIFMGDVGSAFLGYTFATLPLLVSPTSNKMPIAALLFVWPFVFDTGFTLLRRLFHGENIFAPHRSHLYQRLTICGYSHRFVTLLYLLQALFSAILGIWWTTSGTATGPVIIPILILESTLLWYFVVHQERQQLSTLSKI